MNAVSAKVLQQQQYFNGGKFCPLDFWASANLLEIVGSFFLLVGKGGIY